MFPCSPSPALLREILPLFGHESSGSIPTYWKQTFCKARNQALSAVSNIGQNCGGFSPAFSLCVSLCSLLGLGKLVLILLCFIQPCSLVYVWAALISCSFPFLTFLSACVQWFESTPQILHGSTSSLLTCFPCCVAPDATSLSASPGKSGGRGSCSEGRAGAPEVREVAALTDGRPLWCHRAPVPALPARASGVESWHLLCLGWEGGRQCPPTGTGTCCMTWCSLSGIRKQAVCSVATEQRKSLGLLKSNPIGICLFPLVILPLSSALWKFPSPPLSFPFPLLSLYLPHALTLLFPYFSFIPSWWEKSRISLFRDQIPLAHLFLTAVHGTAHPWVSKENVCICSVVTIPHEKRKSNSLLPFPASDALNSPSHLSSITFSVVIFPTIIHSQYLSWHLPGAMDPTVLHHNGRESLVFFENQLLPNLINSWSPQIWCLQFCGWL